MDAARCIFFVLLGGWALLAAILFVPSAALAGAVEPTVGSACGDGEDCHQGNIDRIGKSEIVINDGMYRLDSKVTIDLDRLAVGQTVAYRADQERNIIYLELLGKGEQSQAPPAEEASPPPPRRSGKDSEPRQEKGVWRN